ncbi:MAG: PTS IIA-like nitrogen regulatory protein PtsN [Alphaproteobacteria bacterium]
MELSDILRSDAVIEKLAVTSKKQVLQEISRRASMICDLDERTIFDTLLERERLGTTGVGNGIAIPHGRLSGLDRPVGIFARLTRAIDFDAVDDQPVDIVFALLAPNDAGADHLKALARVSRLFRNREMCEKLRGSDEADALYGLLTEPTATTSHAA